MDRSTEDGDPYATGFEYSRREILKTGAAVGLAGVSAGCGTSTETGPGGDTPTRDDTASPTPTQATTVSPTPEASEEVGALVDDDLTILDSGFSSKQDRLQNFFTVRVRNDLQDQTMSSVGISVEFFDADLEYLEFQNATIAYLGPQEVFEGYLTYYSEEAAAYAVRAERTLRQSALEDLDGLSVVDHCIDDEEVRGTVENVGTQRVRRLVVRVAFYDGDGDRVATNSQNITDRQAGGQTDFSVEFDDVIGDPDVGVEDYSISVGDIGNELLAVR